MPDVILLAQEDNFWVYVAVGAIVAIVVFASVAGALVNRYRICPSNRIMVVYGRSGSDGVAARCIHGGGTFIWPILNDHAFLALEPIRIEVSRKMTSQGRQINDPLPRVFSVAIGTTPELMTAAAIRLLGLPQEEIKQQAEDMIVAQLHRLLDAIEAGQLQPGSEEYHERLQTSISDELSQLGLTLINVRRE